MRRPADRRRNGAMTYPLRDRILGPVLAFSLALGLGPGLAGSAAAEDAAALARALERVEARGRAPAMPTLDGGVSVSG